MTKGSKPAALFFALLIVLALASHVFVIRPLLDYNKGQPADKRLRIRDNVGPVVYFGGIGLGFMAVEMGLIQRTIVFLGHPSYSLSVVLFTLLLFTGIGSAVSTRIADPASVRGPLTGVILGLAVMAFGLPPVLLALHHLDLPLRIAVSVVCIAPLATGMGVVLPMGMRLIVNAGKGALVPWMWAVNGVFGVAGTVLSMFIAMTAGYTALILAGCVAYGATMWAASRSDRWQRVVADCAGRPD